MLGSAEVHPIKRIPSFNPESVKILPLLFFFSSLSLPFRPTNYRRSVVISLLRPREGDVRCPSSTRSMKPGPVYSVVKDAVIKEWRKQLELVFCVDPPRFGGVQGGVVAL